jgi:hypothetical protein
MRTHLPSSHPAFAPVVCAQVGRFNIADQTQEKLHELVQNFGFNRAPASISSKVASGRFRVGWMPQCPPWETQGSAGFMCDTPSGLRLVLSV